MEDFHHPNKNNANSVKPSQEKSEAGSLIIKTEIKTELKVEAPDYVDQSVWDSIKAPVENIEIADSVEVSTLNKNSANSGKPSQEKSEAGSMIIKTEIKTELKVEAPDYVDQSVWDSIKAPVENIEIADSEEVSTLKSDDGTNNACDICEKSFKRADSLKRHFKTVHEGVKRHKCETCEKAFGKSGSLKRHIEMVHKNYAV